MFTPHHRLPVQGGLEWEGRRDLNCHGSRSIVRQADPASRSGIIASITQHTMIRLGDMCASLCHPSPKLLDRLKIALAQQACRRRFCSQFFLLGVQPYPCRAARGATQPRSDPRSSRKWSRSTTSVPSTLSCSITSASIRYGVWCSSISRIRYPLCKLAMQTPCCLCCLHDSLYRHWYRYRMHSSVPYL